MIIFFLLLVSMICSSGMAIVLVEKRFDWPIRPFSIITRRILQLLVHRKMHRVLLCSMCTAFWTPVFCDLFIRLTICGTYWLWPFSGFAAAGFTWFVYQITKRSRPDDGKADNS